MGANTLGALNRQEAAQLLHSGQLKTCSAEQSVRPCSCSDWDTCHPSQKGESGGHNESQYGDDIETYLGKLQYVTSFGDDFPNINHDSRVREDSEVVIIYLDFWIYKC